MPPLAPYTLPARAAIDYPEVRVSVLNLTQRGVGQPVDVGYRIDRYRVTTEGAEDAPPAGAVSAVTRLELADLATDPDLAQAVATITTYAVARAIADGLLWLEGQEPPPQPPIEPPQPPEG